MASNTKSIVVFSLQHFLDKTFEFPYTGRKFTGKCFVFTGNLVKPSISGGARGAVALKLHKINLEADYMSPRAGASPVSRADSCHEYIS